MDDYYPWIKALHILSVIAWMAALFYLPRLCVYHVEADAGSRKMLALMELRLLKIIATPAMLATWIFGLWLAATPGLVDWQALWPWGKLAAVLAMTAFHFWLAAKRRQLAEGTCRITARQFRIANEVPTILVLIIVIFVVVRPF